MTERTRAHRNQGRLSVGDPFGLDEVEGRALRRAQLGVGRAEARTHLLGLQQLFAAGHARTVVDRWRQVVFVPLEMLLTPDLPA